VGVVGRVCSVFFSIGKQGRQGKEVRETHSLADRKTKDPRRPLESGRRSSQALHSSDNVSSEKGRPALKKRLGERDSANCLCKGKRASIYWSPLDRSEVYRLSGEVTNDL